MAFIFLTVLFDFYLVMKVKVCKKKKKLNFLHLSPRENQYHLPMAVVQLLCLFVT